MTLKIKENKYKAFLFLFSLLLIGGGFYWFQIRPSQIKHDCSWVKQTYAGEPAKPAMTEDELRQKGVLDNCTRYTSIFEPSANQFVASFKSSCEEGNRRKIDEYKTPKEAIPLKDWWEPATPQEYSFCLHDKGL